MNDVTRNPAKPSEPKVARTGDAPQDYERLYKDLKRQTQNVVLAVMTLAVEFIPAERLDEFRQKWGDRITANGWKPLFQRDADEPAPPVPRSQWSQE